MSDETPETYADAARRYRLEGRIATGGMGEVWRATDTVLGRTVAVKLLKSEYADDPTFRSRFEDEARHAAALHHPNVCAVYDVGEAPATDGSGVPRPFLVMELVDGQPLSALLRGGRKLDPAVMRDLLAQAADAIGAAHVAGIVHRDVKPANLMVTPDRTIKITDFGIARASDGLGLTGTGQVMGTPQYLSPEQARGNPATPASDVYSLGVVAWECLAGYRPFDKGTPVATALSHLNDPVPPLPDTVPRDLATVVERALTKDPRQRYADGNAFATALRDPAAAATEIVRLPPLVPDVGLSDATSVMTAVVAPTASRPRTPPEPVRPVTLPPEPVERRRGLNPGWIVAGLVLLAAIVVLLVLQLTGGSDSTGPGTPVTPPPSSASTPSATPSATPTEDPTPQPFDLNESDYVGRPIDQVLGELRSLGLDPQVQVKDNPGDEDPGIVTSVSPSRGLQEGTTVQVTYWDETQEPEPTAAPTPTPPPTPTPKPTPSDTSTGGGVQSGSVTPAPSISGLLGNGRRETGRETP